jgi:replication fork clamp-binding protein CrfC
VSPQDLGAIARKLTIPNDISIIRNKNPGFFSVTYFSYERHKKTRNWQNKNEIKNQKYLRALAVAFQSRISGINLRFVRLVLGLSIQNSRQDLAGVGTRATRATSNS